MRRINRQLIYKKYNGHCAYCGKKISLKEMQVDHFIPQQKPELYKGDIHEDKNLMPACRLCNYHKSTFSINEFRRELLLKLKRIYSSNISILEQYGLLKRIPKKIVFYYENHKQEES